MKHNTKTQYNIAYIVWKMYLESSNHSDWGYKRWSLKSHFHLWRRVWGNFKQVMARLTPEEREGALGLLQVTILSSHHTAIQQSLDSTGDTSREEPPVKAQTNDVLWHHNKIAILFASIFVIECCQLPGLNQLFKDNDDRMLDLSWLINIEINVDVGKEGINIGDYNISILLTNPFPFKECWWLVACVT